MFGLVSFSMVCITVNISILTPKHPPVVREHICFEASVEKARLENVEFLMVVQKL